MEHCGFCTTSCAFQDAVSSMRRRRGFVWDEHTQRMQGLLLCSVVQEGVAHMTQISIASHLRGRGLGRFLLRHALTELTLRGFESITLTVTKRNAAAMRLYTSFGFEERTDFDAMVWVKDR